MYPCDLPPPWGVQERVPGTSQTSLGEGDGDRIVCRRPLTHGGSLDAPGLDHGGVAARAGRGYQRWRRPPESAHGVASRPCESNKIGYRIGYSEGGRLSTLPNAPLAIVALELRFPEQPQPLGQQARRLIRDVLRPVLPLVENITENTIEIGLGAPAPLTTQRTFPKFVNRTRTCALVINPSTMVLETTVYEGYEKFRALIEEVAMAVKAVLQPDGIFRIGLRYIDEIRVPSITKLPGDWSGYIDPHFLAAVDPDLLEETGLTPEHWQGLVRYSTGPDSALQLRYGPGDGHAVNPAGPTRRLNAPPPGPFFLLDSDSFWEPQNEVPEFDVETILDACDRLHPATRSIFSAVSEQKLVEEVYSRSPEPAGR